MDNVGNTGAGRSLGGQHIQGGDAALGANKPAWAQAKPVQGKSAIVVESGNDGVLAAVGTQASERPSIARPQKGIESINHAQLEQDLELSITPDGNQKRVLNTMLLLIMAVQAGRENKKDAMKEVQTSLKEMVASSELAETKLEVAGEKKLAAAISKAISEMINMVVELVLEVVLAIIQIVLAFTGIGAAAGALLKLLVTLVKEVGMQAAKQIVKAAIKEAVKAALKTAAKGGSKQAVQESFENAFKKSLMEQMAKFKGTGDLKGLDLKISQAMATKNATQASAKTAREGGSKADIKAAFDKAYKETMDQQIAKSKSREGQKISDSLKEKLVNFDNKLEDFKLKHAQAKNDPVGQGASGGKAKLKAEIKTKIAELKAQTSDRSDAMRQLLEIGQMQGEEQLLTSGSQTAEAATVGSKNADKYFTTLEANYNVKGFKAEIADLKGDASKVKQSDLVHDTIREMKANNVPVTDANLSKAVGIKTDALRDSGIRVQTVSRNDIHNSVKSFERNEAKLARKDMSILGSMGDKAKHKVTDTIQDAVVDRVGDKVRKLGDARDFYAEINQDLAGTLQNKLEDLGTWVENKMTDYALDKVLNAPETAAQNKAEFDQLDADVSARTAAIAERLLSDSEGVMHDAIEAWDEQQKNVTDLVKMLRLVVEGINEADKNSRHSI